MSATATPTLSHERCVAIARMILGDDATDAEIVEHAEQTKRIAATLPPLSPEQRDALAVLLRP